MKDERVSIIWHLYFYFFDQSWLNVEDYYYLTMSSHLTSYFKSKYTLSELASSTLTISTTSRKRENKSKSPLTLSHSKDPHTNIGERSIQGNSLRQRIDRRLKQSYHCKNKGNITDNLYISSQKEDHPSERLSCIRKMLFATDSPEQAVFQKNIIKISKNLRRTLKDQFEERQHKALKQKKQRSLLLLRQKERKEMEDCTFKPKLNKYRCY